MVTIPTIQQLYDDIIADIQTEFGITIPTTGPNYLRAHAAVLAAKLKLYYLGIAGLQKNMFADTADPEASGGTLERFGRAKIGRDPYPASQGVYDVNVSGTIGATIPAGSTFVSDDTSLHRGMLFVLDNAFVLTASPDTITLRALTAGTVAQLLVGDTLSSTAPIANVNDAAQVITEAIEPIDAENIEDYRAIVLQSFRLYPQGGASADYRLWGLDAIGVKQIYPYTASGAPNEVNVFVEATVGASTDGMGTPTGPILAEVEADIETDPVTGNGRRPLGVFAVNVAAVIINKIDVTITGASSISAANRTLINLALAGAINSVRPFIAGADTLAERNDVFGTNNIISVILSTVPGAIFSGVAMTIQIGAGPLVPTVSKTFDLGNIPFLTSVTYS
jgi:uncharacterized phage protein gp47/JayE